MGCLLFRSLLLAPEPLRLEPPHRGRLHLERQRQGPLKPEPEPEPEPEQAHDPKQASRRERRGTECAHPHLRWICHIVVAARVRGVRDFG